MATPFGTGFPKPGLGSIVSAVIGFGDPGPKTGLFIANIQIDPKRNFARAAMLYAGRIDKLGMSFKSFKEPLNIALNEVVLPSIIKNFASQGRPPWAPLKKSTVRRRLLEGFPRGPILDKTGKLKREATRKNNWAVGNIGGTSARSASKGGDMLYFRANYFEQKVPYGKFHQRGARYITERRTGNLSTRIGRTKASGVLPTSGDWGVSEWTQLYPDISKLPARPFIQLTLDEEAEVFTIFTSFMVRKVNEHWGRGSAGR